MDTVGELSKYLGSYFHPKEGGRISYLKKKNYNRIKI